MNLHAVVAAELAKDASQGKDPAQVSTEEKSDQTKDSKSEAEDQKADRKTDQSDEGGSGKEKEESESEDTAKEESDDAEDEKQEETPAKKSEESKEKDEKPKPFDKHPAFQRLTRHNKSLKKTVSELKESQAEMLDTLKEIAAHNKGEEYTKEKKEPTVQDFDFDEILDTEVEVLVASVEKEGKDVGENFEEEIIEIAKEYATEVEGKQVYLTAGQAYKMWQRLHTQESADSTEQKKSPSKKPSSRGSKSEKKVGSLSEMVGHNGSLHDIIARAVRVEQTLS